MKRTSAPRPRRRLGSLRSLCVILAASFVVLSVAGVIVVLAADQFFAGDGTALNTPKWGATAAGPFNSTFTNGSVANFAAPNGTGMGASITVGGINATENFTLTAAGGTISNQSNGVVPVSVSAGKTLDFGAQSFTASSAAGYVKNGGGVLALAGGTYGGGFTLNAGTVIARGVNAFGGNATPGPLNLNGGAVGANANRDFGDKYSAVNVGGDFQLGVPSSAVPISSDAANLTFNSAVALGNTTRTVTVGAGGTYTLSGVISGAAGAGLTVARLSGSTGRLVLGGANTYSGPTTVSAGTLTLTGSGSIANSSSVELAGGSTLDVSGLTTALTLADGQALKANGTTSSATVLTAAGKGLTLAPNSPLQFNAFGGVAPLTVSGAGAVTLSSANSVTVVVSNGGSPLAAGDYTLISKAAGSGGVTGSAPASLTVGGDGLAAGTSASLLVTGQQLVLRIAAAGSLQLSSSAYALNEGGGSVAVTVTRAGGSAGAVSVSYATGGGTATPGADYAAQSGTLNWASGDSSPKSFSVPVTDDNVYEGDETFNVTIGSPAGGATLGTPSVATVTIVENDAAPPTLSVGDVSVAEPSTGISYATFPLTLSAASAQTVTVGFATADGTAAAPGDYAPLNGSVTFSPGETAKTVAVAVKADSVSENSETFSLNLSNSTNAYIADGSGLATVTPPVAAGSVLITEFRLRGPGDPNAPLFSPEADEFVEVYNNTDQDITVADANPETCALQVINTGPATSCGWALVDMQGSASNVPRFVIPAGTLIPARGHFLAAGAGYSLQALAAPDLTYQPPVYSGGESDYTGLALFKTADRARLDVQNVLDAVGFEGVAAPFREGTGLAPPGGVTSNVGHSFVRNQGSGRPVDTNDNRADFTLVATDPSQIPIGVAALGSPGPENSAGPVSRNSGFAVTVPSGVASSVRRNAAVTNGALGTISLRRRFTNNTGQTLSKLRFRVADLSTWNSRQIFGSQAELRVLDATLEGLTGLKAAKVETVPSQPYGGGINSALLINGALTLSSPLAPGQSVDVEFLLGVMRGGSYQFILVVEGAQ